MNGQEQSGDLRARLQEQKQAFDPLDPRAVAERTRSGQAIDKILSMVNPDTGMSMMMQPDAFAQMQRVAKVYADSDMVPQHFRGKPGNVIIAMNLAQRLGVDLFMIMQSLYVVHGRPGLEAKLVIAMVNQRGPFTGPIQWEMVKDKTGKTVECTAFATHKITGERCAVTIDWPTVVGEGWDKNPKWNTMRDQMFRYRTAAWLKNAYCPEVTLGLGTAEEMEDVAITEAPAKAKPPAPRFNTVGEISVYAASVGVPDEDFAEMTRTVGITRKKITHTEDKLDSLATLVDAWQPQAPAPVADPEPTPPETIPEDAPPPPVEEKPVTVVDETGEDNADVPDEKLKARPVITKRGVTNLLAQGKLAGLDEAGVLAAARQAVGAPIEGLADLLADEVPLVMSTLAREGE